MSSKRLTLFLSINLVLGTGAAYSQITPSGITLGPSQQQQFSVPGQQQWTWSVTPYTVGSITPTGLYTAPATYQSSYVYVYARSGSMYYQTEIQLSQGAVSSAGTSPTVAISVSPASIYLYGGQSAQFTASVSGNANTQVIWSISQGVGSIVNGLYSAPSSVSSDSLVTILATSVADPTKSASATILLGPAVTPAVTTPPPSDVSITLRPRGSSLQAGQSRQFSATVSGSSDTAVTWSLSPNVGTVSNGLYTAPSTISATQVVQITATSVADSTQSATSNITLNASVAAAPPPPPPPPPPAATSVSPATATVAPGGTGQFSVQNLPSGVTVAWAVSPAVGSIASSGLYTAPSPVAAQQILTVTATNSSTQAVLGTATLTLTATPQTPSVTPSTVTVAPAGTQQFTVQNLPSGTTVRWSISPTTGSISGGLYTAPATVPTQTTVTVTAKNASTHAVLATATLTLTATPPPPPSVSPATASVGPWGTQQFSVQNLPSGVTAAWSVNPATGSIASSGLYTAPNTVATQTTVTVTATNSSTNAVLGTATLTLTATPSPSVTPSTVTLAPSGTQQFSVQNPPSGVTVAWSVSPATGSIASSGLYTAPNSVATQTTVTVTATNSSTQAVLGTATLTLQASPPPAVTNIVLPVEVMGANSATAPVSFTIPSGTNVSGPLQLWLQIHGLEYQTQASVRVNNGSLIPINDTTATYLGHSATFGGIGGGFSTLQLTINLPSGAIVQGQNTLTFYFNGTDGVSSGFRVLNLNILSNGSQLISQSSFTQDDPSTWAPPLNDAADIQAGQTLWNSASLTAPGTGPILAKCGNCHTEDGRDLKYFNYSNLSIETRSMFHGLTAQQGAQIASYIRTLNAPASSYGRPWNPPYQPGPGIDERAVSDWAAGAGLDAVLDLDADSLPYIMPGGSTANLGPNAFLDQREIPIELQLRDWNHWLPTVYPLDAFGSVFSNSGLITGLNLLRSELIPNDPTTYSEYHLGILTWETNAANLASVVQPQDSPAWSNPVYDRQIYSIAQWLMVKSWELNQEFGLESMPQAAFGPQAESRAWYSNQAFFTSPFMLKIPQSNAPGIGNGSQIAYIYDSFIWYQTQLILNDGNGTAQGTWPIDWGYATAYLQSNITWNNVTGTPRVGTAGLMLEWATKDNQAGDINVNPYGLINFPTQVSTYSEISAAQEQQILNAYLQSWLERVQPLSPQQFFAWNGASPVFSSLNPGSFSGDLAYALPELRYAGADPNLLNQAATWAAQVWPAYNWSADLNAPCTVGNSGQVTCQ